jgi:hypothetical protein
MGSPLDGDAEDDMTYEKLEAEAREVTDYSIYLQFLPFAVRWPVLVNHFLLGSENNEIYSWEIKYLYGTRTRLIKKFPASI